MIHFPVLAQVVLILEYLRALVAWPLEWDLGPCERVGESVVLDLKEEIIKKKYKSRQQHNTLSCLDLNTFRHLLSRHLSTSVVRSQSGLILPISPALNASIVSK